MSKLALIKLLTKRKLPISIRFSIRPHYDIIQIRISINGKEGSPFSTLSDGTILHKAGLAWNQHLQRVSGRSEVDRLFNLAIDDIRSDINHVYDQQLARGIVPTPKSVQQEYQTQTHSLGITEQAKASTCSVLHCYKTYSKELKTGGFPEKDLQKTTLDKWSYGLTYLESYVEHTKADDPLSTASADELTLFWAKSYHRWLMKEGPMSADSATRYANRLIEALNYVAESGMIKLNPLANLKLPRGKTKDVYFLEPDHLARFWRLDLSGDTATACWWMGVIFLTGLDHCDAVRYVENRPMYERTTDWGPKIVINRSKPPLAECHIPILPELEALLARRPAGPSMPDWQVNREMYAIATLIGFPHRLTCKVGRKTAGAIFYAEYEDIGAVSRMLGHSRITITERYYVKTTGHTVDKAMQKRYVNPTQYQPFRRVAYKYPTG